MVTGLLEYIWGGDEESEGVESCESYSSGEKESNGWLWIDVLRGQEDEHFVFVEKDITSYANETDGSSLSKTKSYAEIVKQPFSENESKDGAYSKHKRQDSFRSEFNLAKATLLAQSIQFVNAERLISQGRLHRQRKHCNRYSPFPIKDKVSKTALVRYARRAISSPEIWCEDVGCSLITYPSQTEIKRVEVSDDLNGWKTVNKKWRHGGKFKPFPNIKGSRYAVDIGTDFDFDIRLLRVRSSLSSVQVNRSKSLIDLCTVVEEVKHQQTNDLDKNLAVPYLKHRIFCRHEGKKKIDWKVPDLHFCVSKEKLTWKPESHSQSQEEHVLLMKYILGMQARPLSIEWKSGFKRTVQNVHPVEMVHGSHLIEKMFVHFLKLAVTLTSYALDSIVRLNDCEVAAKEIVSNRPSVENKNSCKKGDGKKNIRISNSSPVLKRHWHSQQFQYKASKDSWRHQNRNWLKNVNKTKRNNERRNYKSKMFQPIRFNKGVNARA